MIKTFWLNGIIFYRGAITNFCLFEIVDNKWEKSIKIFYIIYVHYDDVCMKFLASIFQDYLKITLHFLNDIPYSFSYIKGGTKEDKFWN